MSAAQENDYREMAWDFIIESAQERLDELNETFSQPLLTEAQAAIQKRIDLLRNIRKNYFIMNLLEETDREGR